MNLVLDTNVLVSALLSPFGAPARVLELVLGDEVRLAFDDRILAEYDAVLRRPRFGFDPRDVDALLVDLAASGDNVVTVPWPTPLPDRDDAAFLEVAVAAAALLVTGNVRHYPPNHRLGVTVVTPAELLELWQDAGAVPER